MKKYNTNKEDWERYLECLGKSEKDLIKEILEEIKENNTDNNQEIRI